MARVTIEDCLEKVTNRFELSVAAMKRAKSIHGGAPSLSKENNNIDKSIKIDHYLTPGWDEELNNLEIFDLED